MAAAVANAIAGLFGLATGESPELDAAKEAATRAEQAKKAVEAAVAAKNPAAVQAGLGLVNAYAQAAKTAAAGADAKKAEAEKAMNEAVQKLAAAADDAAKAAATTAKEEADKKFTKAVSDAGSARAEAQKAETAATQAAAAAGAAAPANSVDLDDSDEEDDLPIAQWKELRKKRRDVYARRRTGADVPQVCYDRRRLTRDGRVACANDRMITNPLTYNEILRGRDTHLGLCRNPVTRQMTSKCYDFKSAALDSTRRRRRSLRARRRRLTGF